MDKDKIAIGLAIAACAGLMSCSHQTSTPTPDYSQYVNPFIGTGGHGHTFPGPVAPHGMIQPSPDTRIDGWDACSGYYYEDTTINGFSQNHLSGTGCCDLGDFLIMPIVGEVQWQGQDKESQTLPWASAFSHDKEKSEPGYYSVTLDRYGVDAEITASERGAYYRFHFPDTDSAAILIDIDYSLQRQNNLDMKLVQLSDTEIAGTKTTKYWAFEQTASFYAKFSQPFTYELITENEGDENIYKAILRFKAKANEPIEVKLGISATDMDGAKRNAESELGSKDFETVKTETRQKWNEYLSKIEIDTDNADERTIFYTAMYHTGMSPYLFSDVDGRYRGMDREIHQGDVNKPIYTVFSLWDTFRAFHPLMTIIDPDLNSQFINSLLTKSKEGGLLPMWELYGNYTACMIGYHSAPVIVDAYMKGDRSFDAEYALKALMRASVNDTTDINSDPLVIAALNPKSKELKNTLGYAPCDVENETVAKALEYAYDDWCIARLAEALGKKDIAAKYDKLAQAYKKYFDPSTRFMRGKDSKGNWRTPFNPRSSNHRGDDYCEGTAWQWTWFVPQDINGLISLMGGNDGFVSKLDSLFTADSSLEGELVSADISGLIGQYAQGNEPSHHIIHLYNYAGVHYRTQELMDSVLNSQYFNDPNGLSGNEDCGQMSAWFVLNSIGFYQVTPGKPLYSIGRPLFNQATINLPNGNKFTVIAKNNSRTNKYIKKITLNGKELTKPFFTHEELMKGGTLTLEMSSTK
jgi:predicted alpha-1,2-mannosidase